MTSLNFSQSEQLIRCKQIEKLYTQDNSFFKRPLIETNLSPSIHFSICLNELQRRLGLYWPCDSYNRLPPLLMKISGTVQKNKLFVYQGSIITKMKMPLCLSLVDNRYEPKQLQPTRVLSSHPSHASKLGRVFALTD